jgi:hypothetical protein
MRLEKYIHFWPTTVMTNIIVKVMVEVISTLGVVTKEISRGRTSTTFFIDVTQKDDLRAEKFLKKRAGRKAVEDAFLRLDKLTPEEALMAAAETMTVTRDIDDTVKVVDKKLENVDERVLGIDMRTEVIEDKVEGVDSKVQGVDERVMDVDERVKNVDERVKNVDERVKDTGDRVIQGGLSFPFTGPRIRPQPYSVRCKGDWSSHTTSGQSSQQPTSATRPSLIFGLSEVIGNLSAPKRESADIKPDQNSRILRADKQISRFDFLNLGLIGPELILFLA